MFKSALTRNLVLVSGLCLGLSACGTATLERSHGYVPSEEDLENVIVGVDTRDTVATNVGTPSTSGVISDGDYYYVASRWETRLYFKPKEVEREVVAISFDEGGTVSNVERFGLEDGQVVVLNRRVTDDNINRITFLRQLLGNFGNFVPGQFLDN
ncbi:outer membrane protein assembly factor BamE [Actibacterium pelagium]|uniref:Outer membrane protein assembly factor BamE n=1 Tax=Actibacterium pelagium TaxID=2029103 RepID=A0A917EIZ5_9RHOB|nr:outer membrane protein assembly factor BamE [Actibacterium pelagium]GGE41074.1 outer membrane protein assembly factor BamE [Actibacterium pelagium]